MDMRWLVRHRLPDEEKIYDKTKTPVDYFLLRGLHGSDEYQTSLGGLPLARKNWSWPEGPIGALHYFGRINLTDSIDLFPVELQSKCEGLVFQIFLADLFIEDLDTEVYVESINVRDTVFELPQSAMPKEVIPLPKAPMVRTRVPCALRDVSHEALGGGACCDVWNPQGNRVFMIEENGESVLCLEISGLDLDAGGFSGPERAKEVGLDLNGLSQEQINLFQFGGASLLFKVRIASDWRTEVSFQMD